MDEGKATLIGQMHPDDIRMLEEARAEARQEKEKYLRETTLEQREADLKELEQKLKKSLRDGTAKIGPYRDDEAEARFYRNFVFGEGKIVKHIKMP